MFNLIYIIVKQRLLAIPEIKNVEWEMEQDTANNQGALTILPGAYLQFADADMRTLGEGAQEADVEFTVRLKTDCMYDDDKRIYNSAAFTHMDLFTKIHQQLSGFAGLLSMVPGLDLLADTDDDYTVFNALDRVRVSLPRQNRAIITSEQTFTCYAKDYSACKDYEKITRDLLFLEKIVI